MSYSLAAFLSDSIKTSKKARYGLGRRRSNSIIGFNASIHRCQPEGHFRCHSVGAVAFVRQVDICLAPREVNLNSQPHEISPQRSQSAQIKALMPEGLYKHSEDVFCSLLVPNS